MAFTLASCAKGGSSSSSVTSSSTQSATSSSSAQSTTSSSTQSTSSSSAITREADNRGLDKFTFTTNNIVGTDGLGRYSPSADKTNGKTVGMFYFLWHGTHETGIYDVSKLLVDHPTEVLNPVTSSVSPVGEFHYESEPLYGYYDSADPYVIARHLELLTNAGVDYLVFDTTNAVTYNNVITSLLDIFATHKAQGWKVPQIAFYTNSSPEQTVDVIYNLIYKTGLHSDLWYCIDGKPLLMTPTPALSDDAYNLYNSFFHIKESQWPDKRPNYKEGFPWMDWSYPQGNYDGTMSVSVAQAPGYNSADPKSAFGRGFSYKDMKNDSLRMYEGSNYEEEWQTALHPEKTVNNVFLTGWNEWMAIKQVRGTNEVVYCDVYDREFSREIEMENGPLGDNFYLQTLRNIRSFKYEEAKHYEYDIHTIDFDKASSWDGVKSIYADFVGDAQKRNHRNCVIGAGADAATYTDDSARNDIAESSLTHDSKNLYLKVTTKDNLTEPAADDSKWMNVLLNSYSEENKRFAGNFDYRINASRDIAAKTCSIEKYSGSAWENVGSASLVYSEKTLQISIPLSLIGKTVDECHLSFKVSDNITKPDDIMDYYVSGDSAPLGRASYEYGY